MCIQRASTPVKMVPFVLDVCVCGRNKRPCRQIRGYEKYINETSVFARVNSRPLSFFFLGKYNVRIIL